MKKSPVLIVVATAAVLGVVSFIVLSAASFLSGNKRTSSALPVVGSDKVALVRLEGLLVSSEDVVEELNDYAEDDSIKAIVIRIDKPRRGRGRFPGDLQRRQEREE